MSKLYIVLLLFCFLFKGNSYSQTLFHQDIFKGGVTAGGFSTGQGSGSGTFNLHIEPNSTIRKAYAFTYRQGYAPQASLDINGSNFLFDTTKILMQVDHKVSAASPVSLYYFDLTNYLNTNITSTFNITIPTKLGLPVNWGYWTIFIYIEYENPTLSETASSLWINDKDFLGNEIYNYNSLMPINNLNPVSLSLYSDRTPDTVFGEGYNSYINSNFLGTIGGTDNTNSLWSAGGVKGHFYYQNNTLFGLDDDTPDNLMGGSDGLADIASYINNNATALDVRLTHQKYPSNASGRTNVNLAQILTYTTSCTTFTTTLTPDTTICFGQTLQLQATGGTPTTTSTGYEWTSLTNPSALNDLSCTDCPNPIFSGDSSQVYTVRIYNTDSCSVVKPISIGVSHPQEIGFKTFRSICSFSNGQIVIEDSPDNAVQIGTIRKNGDTLSPNSSNAFNGLSAGDYTLFYIDKFGCNYDTLVTIEPVISTVAQFNANPKTGTAPIQINLTNQSKNATDYSWWINDAYQGSQLPSFYADTSGIYEIELIAWRNDSICVDTFAFTVFIFDSLIVGLPNVFTPNNDGVNDFFNIKVNLPVTYNLVILNRWGNVVFENEDKLSKGTHKLWNGDAQNDELVNDGVYFYKISFELDDAQQCNCSTGVNCEITNCEVVSEGFVQVYGEK